MTRASNSGWWGRITGEISKLRTAVTGWSIRTGRLGGGYKLNSSRVDYTLARQLYDNTADNYKLGGAFAKPVVNTTVAFMGVPRFRSEDEGGPGGPGRLLRRQREPHAAGAHRCAP